MVLDVPQESIAFGIWLSGTGRVSFVDVHFGEMEDEVTGSRPETEYPKGPINLDFLECYG